MKTEREIREKIEEYMERLSGLKRNSFVIHGGDAAREYEGFIDALLWVIGDNGGLLR